MNSHLAAHGAELVVFDLNSVSPDELSKALATDGATAVLILAGYPEPAASVVEALRNAAGLEDVLIGTPAGQAEFAE